MVIGDKLLIFDVEGHSITFTFIDFISSVFGRIKIVCITLFNDKQGAFWLYWKAHHTWRHYNHNLRTLHNALNLWGCQKLFVWAEKRLKARFRCDIDVFMPVPTFHLKLVVRRHKRGRGHKQLSRRGMTKTFNFR